MKSRIFLPALLALFAAAQAAATDPAEGTIDEQNTQVMASGGPYAVSNPSATGTGEPTCSGSGQDCDEFLLTLDLSQGYRDANPNAVIVIDLISSGDDLDMYIYDDQDNLNCLFAGKKRLIFWHPRHKTSIETEPFGWVVAAGS